MSASKVKLRFGVSLPVGPNVSDFARRAEGLAFDYLTCGEHVMSFQPTLNSFVALSAAAGCTASIGLLSAVAILPLYPAVLLAKLATTLDYVSGGRFNLGVGIGGEFPEEFEACGIRPEERTHRAEEGLRIVDALLRGRELTYQGVFCRLTRFELSPKPVQAPRPPIWIGGRTEAAMRRAARHGDWWLPYLYTPEQLANSIETVRQFAVETGNGARVPRPAVSLFMTVYPDGQKARRTATNEVGRIYHRDVRRFHSRYLVSGSPRDCQVRLGEYVDAGAETILLRLAGPVEDMMGMLERVAQEVVPSFDGSH